MFNLIPPILGACLILGALLQEHAAWPMREVIECKPAALVNEEGCLRHPLPKNLRGKKHGGASHVLQDGRPIRGVLRTTKRVAADLEPHLALTSKTVVWKPLAGADEATQYRIVLAPDFTFWFWILVLAGAAPILHHALIVRGGREWLAAMTARWERNFTSLPRPAQNRRLTFAFALTLVLLCVFSEKIRDFGYDGLWYAKIADRGPGVLADQDGLAMHSMQRIAPMMLVHGAARVIRELMSATGLEVTVTDADRETGLKHFTSRCLLLAFYIVGVAWLTASAVSALCVFDRLQLTARGKLTGFILLFASFPTLRLFAYYPNLSDYYGFALGVFSYHAYLSRRWLLQVVIAVIGAYTFPMVSVVSLGLLAASIEGCGTSGMKLPVQRLPRLRWWLAAAATVISAVVFWSLAPQGAALIAANCTQPLPWLFPVSVACCALYVGAVTHGFCHAMRGVTPRLISWLGGGLLALALFFSIQFSIAVVFGEVAKGGQSFFWLLKILSATSVIDPFCFLGAHLAYFGLIVVFAVIAWGGMWAEAARHGLSLCLLLALLLVLSLMSESRCLSNVLPVMVFLISKSIPEHVSPARCLIAQLLVCWTWLPLRQGSTYFMPFGPWNEHWLAWLKLAIFATALFVLCRTRLLFAQVDLNAPTTPRGVPASRG